MSQKRRSGHYCWSCDRTRANEKFSGKGHARHLCKDCARLGTEELAYRQTMRDLDRSLTWDGHIPKRNREQFLKYLNHKDEQIRDYAYRIETTHAWAVAEQRLDREIEEFLSELATEEGIAVLDIDHSLALDSSDNEIPF